MQNLFNTYYTGQNMWFEQSIICDGHVGAPVWLK